MKMLEIYLTEKWRAELASFRLHHFSDNLKKNNNKIPMHTQ